MKLLAKILLLSLLLCLSPFVRLSASELGFEDDYPIMDEMVKGYISVYVLYPKIETYELNGAKNDKAMDIVKMERYSGLGMGGIMGFWVSPDMALEVDVQYLGRTERRADPIEEAAKDNQGKSLKVGHVSELETQAWKFALMSKYYLSSLLGANHEGDIWYNEEQEKEYFILAPYLEGGVSVVYDSKIVKEISLASNLLTKTEAHAQNAAYLQNEDQILLKKFNESKLFFVWQLGAGVDYTVGEHVVSLGYRVDFNLQDPIFKQKINNSTYEFSYNRLKIHNAILAVKFLF